MKINNTNKCFSQAEITEFVINPLLSENEDIATHLSSCDKCGNIMKLVSDVASSSTDITKDDVKTVRDFLASKEQEENPLLLKLHDLIRSLSPQVPVKLPTLNAQPSFGVSRSMFRRTPLLKGASTATPNTKQQPAPEIVKMLFAARCESDNLHYWRAELILTKSIIPENNLKVTVTDKDDNLIPQGTLSLFGNNLQVENGKTQLNFNQFKEGLNNSEVMFIFNSSVVTEGDLIFI